MLIEILVPLRLNLLHTQSMSHQFPMFNSEGTHKPELIFKKIYSSLFNLGVLKTRLLLKSNNCINNES